MLSSEQIVSGQCVGEGAQMVDPAALMLESGLVRHPQDADVSGGCAHQEPLNARGPDVESQSTEWQPLQIDGQGLILSADDRHTILKAIPDLIVRVSRDGQCVVHSWSPNNERVAEHERPALLTEVLPEDLAIQARQAVAAALDTGTLQRFDCELRLPAGDLRSYEVRVVPFQADEVLAIVRDVTQRTFSEELLRASELRLRQIIDAMNVYVGLLSPDGTLIESNRVTLDIAGLRRSDVLGRKLWDAYWFSDLPDSQNLLRQAVQRAARGEEMRFDAMGRISESERISIDVSIRPLMNARREVELLVATGVDVTQRLKAHDEVRRLHADLAHVLRISTIDQMAAGIAHEINQPLTAIQNYSHALGALQGSDRISAGLNIQSIVTAIEDQVQRASDIIRSLRDLVRKGTSRREPSNLNDLIGRVLTVVEADAKSLDIAIETYYDENLPLVNIDGVQIQQVVLNLVRNAVESIGASRTGSPRICVTTARLSDDYAIVTVVDGGPGLDSNAMESAFQAFYSTKPAGLGMGLPLCRSIVEAHGGRIWAQSVPGQETVFHFTIPFVAAEQRNSCLVT